MRFIFVEEDSDRAFLVQLHFTINPSNKFEIYLNLLLTKTE